MSSNYRDWQQANQRYLMAALAIVRWHLERHIERLNHSPSEADLKPLRQTLQTTADSLPAPAALDVLCEIFNLSQFEQTLLLLCAGMELDGSFSALCAAAQINPQQDYPTLGLAFAALPNPDWEVLSFAKPLRYWRLLEIAEGKALTTSQLRIDPCILQYLTGVKHLDDRFNGIVEPLLQASELTQSQQAIAAQLAATWAETTGTGIEPVLQLCGDEVEAKRSIALALCDHFDLNLQVMSAAALPSTPSDINTLLHLWQRYAALTASALLLDCDELESADPARDRDIRYILEHTNGLTILTSRQRRQLTFRPMISVDVNKPTVEEQRRIWENNLGDAIAALNGQIDRLVFQFNLRVSDIQAACLRTVGQLSIENAEAKEIGTLLWDACRMQARPQLEDLAQRIDPIATWTDLVLPQPQKQTLREIAIHVRQRAKVYETWGFARKGLRGLGTSALFSGSSGTGKTMAAEVLAQELRLDLYRIDLSAVVSKYIGETEKNLKRVFDAAETGGAILLFDEADALFGKRTETKDSHDRYANIEVSYLLQRMEAYRGLAILTTNLPESMDTAFLRRLQFIVRFPFPDFEQRVLMWQQIFPPQAETQALDFYKLAKLNVAGGNIRNIALSAAFLAAEDNTAITMKHLLKATQGEYIKLERSLTEGEINNWVEAQ